MKLCVWVGGWLVSYTSQLLAGGETIDKERNECKKFAFCSYENINLTQIFVVILRLIITLTNDVFKAYQKYR